MMQEFDDSESDEMDHNMPSEQKLPFKYDYYLSNSIDIFQEWKVTIKAVEGMTRENRHSSYLAKEFPMVKKIQKFRTADIVRLRAFIHMLKISFEDLLEDYQSMYDPKYLKTTTKQYIPHLHKTSKNFQERLLVLIGYMQQITDQKMGEYWPEGVQKLQKQITQIVVKLFTYVTDLKLLWELSCLQSQLSSETHHSISLGGNHAYYTNFMRSMLKRHWQLKELYDKLVVELKKEKFQTKDESLFLTEVVSGVIGMEGSQRLTQKEKADFIDSMKGLYFLEIDLRKQNLYYEYLLTSFHLDMLVTQNMFKDYEELQKLFIAMLQQSKKDRRIVGVSFAIEIDRLPFQKRTKTPQLQQSILDIVSNYIGVAKHLLNQQKIFKSVGLIPLDEAYASTIQFLQKQNSNSLIGLLMCIQEGSKDAFSKGDINVHRIYLEMSELIKQIYLSYENDNWIFPSTILLYIPLNYFVDIFDDIKSEVKRTLFTMVEKINQDKMPFKLVYSQNKIIRQKVTTSQYLQVILYFLQQCHQDQEYINLPEIIPNNIETSILYIKSLELKLNQKEPTPDQMPYVKNMLTTCQNYKLTTKFKWYHSKESIEDREIQFNIEKGLVQEWARKIYRSCINERQALQIRNHFQRYRENKGLSVLQLAEIFKYCHGLMPGKEIEKKMIREEDLFTILQEIKMLLGIHFDIFNLNLDEQISLNYIHVCLGLYNSCYDQTPFNQAYLMIMENIMRPYISHPNSSLTSFRNKYPGFFEKWVYSFQIGAIFAELGSYIGEKGQNEQYREDIINKIKYVSGLIDNKQNITKTIKIEELTQSIVVFSTMIGRNSHPLVYIQSIQLFCLFLNSFPQVKKQASLDFMLDSQLLSNQNLCGQMIKHIKQSDNTYLKDEVSMVNSMMGNLVHYMNAVGIRRTNQILELYYGKVDSNFDQVFQKFQCQLLGKVQEECTFLNCVYLLVFALKKQSQKLKKEDKKEDIRQKITQYQKMMKTMTNVPQKPEFHLCDLIFIEDIVTMIDKKQEQSKEKKGNIEARQLFHQLVQKYGTNEDRIYFAQKLDFYDLIISNNNEPPSQREETILIDLLIQNKYKGNQTQLIKKILRQSKKLSQVSTTAINFLQKQTDKIQSHHINKFIHVNNRYPNQKIQQFIIDHIGCERNHAAVKIQQPYLVKDLVRRLEKVPKNVCEELLLRGVREDHEEKIIQFSSNIFQKLLYLPISKFEKVNLKKVEQIHEENQDWNTESEGEEEELTKEEKQIVEQQYKSNDEDNFSGEDQVLQHQPHLINHDEDMEDQQQNSSNDGDRPPIVQMFTEQSRVKEMELYDKFMIAREELDVLVDSHYDILLKDPKSIENEDVLGKVKIVVELMNNMEHEVLCQIVTRMPGELVEYLLTVGLKAEITEAMKEKMQKRRKVVTKPPKWRLQLFSERQESDDSNIQEGDDSSNDDDSDYSQEQYDQDQQMGDISDDDSQRPAKKPKAVKIDEKKPSKFAEDELTLPGMVPTYSKVEEQISGSQLKRQEIIKILQISLYWLLKLPQSQIKSKQITSYYMDILQSNNLGQIFFESCITVLRFEETSRNIEWFVREMKEKNNNVVQIGLQSVSMETAVNNVLYLIKEYQDMNKGKQGYGNILFKESSALLPIAQYLITKLDLPIQNNCLTLLFIYIATHKAKLKSKIKNLDYSLSGSELAQNKKQYKLKYSQLVRIIQSVCKYGNSNSIWEVIEQSMNLKLKSISKLFSCLKGYGGHLYSKLMETGQKILKTIKMSEQHFGMEVGESRQSLKGIERRYHIISKLVLSVKEKIKQFYFINKQNLKEIMEEEMDIYEQMESLKKIPRKLKQNQQKLFKNKEMMQLVQVIIYFIKILKDEFYGKVEDKLFNKLLKYPKMILEATWYYIFIFAKGEKYQWLKPSQIQQFFGKYDKIGTYSFSHLQEVFRLVVYYLNLQSFCTDKFKQFFLPVLMKNHQLSRQITLRFKVPKNGEEEDDLVTQNILVKRQCSFDMAFYQVTGQAIQVEFYQEEGSDYGGLVRELMIGWKGRGIGEEAFFIGKILGIAFKQGVPYGGTLDLGMFVAITNFKVTLQFFKQFDPEIYRSLTYIRDNDPEPLCLKFTVEHRKYGKLIEYELMENGRNIDLVEANKGKYIELYLQKYFYLGRERQLRQVKVGFDTVVYPQYAEIFTPVQMMRQIKGEEVVDVQMLISKAKYEGYSAESVVIKWLWSIVETFDQQKINTFIQFVTGSPKITVYNSSFSITIEKVYEVESLPVAHTCFNTIDLPEYASKDILEKKLLTAIFQGNNSFGIL